PPGAGQTPGYRIGASVPGQGLQRGANGGHRGRPLDLDGPRRNSHGGTQGHPSRRGRACGPLARRRLGLLGRQAMIVGIGTDLVENRRLEAWLAQPRLLNKYFTEKELSDVSESAHPAASLAARFAAKEAFGK